MDGSILPKHLGQLDTVDDGWIEGWAIRPDHDACAQLDVFIDDAMIGRIRAHKFRDDLAQAQVRAGYAMFRYQIPARFGDGCSHALDIRHHTDGSSIYNAPTTFQFGLTPQARAEASRAQMLRELVIQDGTDGDDFLDAVRLHRKVVFVSTFHDLQGFMQYHLAIFDSLAAAGFVVVVVHAAPERRLGANIRLLRPGCYLIVKKNVGYDFGSWAIGLFSIARAQVDLDEMLLINDSILETRAGGIAQMIQRARESGNDVVGVTDSYERVYHLQSYFLWFGARVSRSTALCSFMDGLSFSSDKETVILEGELALTRRLLAEGFRIGCLHPYDRLARRWLSQVAAVVEGIEQLPHVPCFGSGGDTYRSNLLTHLQMVIGFVIKGTPLNPTHFFWDTLLEDGCRIIKRELLLKNPAGVPTLHRLGRFLAGEPTVQAHILEVRQRYGGELVPVFFEQADATGAGPPEPPVQVMPVACAGSIVPAERKPDKLRSPRIMAVGDATTPVHGRAGASTAGWHGAPAACPIADIDAGNKGFLNLDETRGLFGDGWLGVDARLVFSGAMLGQRLVISVFLPQSGGDGGKSISLRQDGGAWRTIMVERDRQTPIVITLPSDGVLAPSVELDCGSAETMTSQDLRQLGVFLVGFGSVERKTKAAA